MLDPAGLLQRIPELNGLVLNYPRLADAVALGDPHGVFRALAEVRSRDTGDRSVVAWLRSRPAEFYRTQQVRLVEWGFFGIGPRFSPPMAIVGSGGEARSTFRMCFLGIPLWPLCEVRIGEDPDGRRFILGELPPNSQHRTVRGALFIALLLSLAGATWWGERTWSVRPVFVVNGLGVPLAVDIGEHHLVLAAGGLGELELSQGNLPFRASRSDGETVVRGELRVDPSQKVIVLNVLGAAPILERVQGGGDMNHCGEAQWARGDVLEAFGRSVGRHGAQLTLAPGGWEACARQLDAVGRSQDAAALARAAAAQEAGNLDKLQLASSLVRAHLGFDADLAWLRPIADAHPLDEGIQRLMLGALRRARQVDEARQRYAELAAAHPDSSAAVVLRADAEPDLLAREAFLMAALAQTPGNGQLLRRLGSLRLAAGRWDEAGELLSSASAAAPELAGELRPAIASAWIASGRSAEAAMVLATTDTLLSLQLEDVRLYVANARRAPRRVPLSAEQAAAQYRATNEAKTHDGVGREMALFLSLGDDVLDARLLAVPDSADRTYLGALARLGRDPVVALRRIGATDDEHLSRLDGTSWILFRGEAIAGGNTELQVRLDRNCPLTDEAADAVRAFVAGNSTEDGLEPLLPEQHAAAILAKSRQAYARKDAAFLRVRAIELDPLHGIVSVGAQFWPANR